MSMPLPLNVVILASSEADFHGIKNVSGLRKPGISPRYTLATIENPQSEKFTNFSKIDHIKIGLWIALDDASERKCRAAFLELRSNPRYRRGFYDTHLPEPVMKVSGIADLQRVVDEVWEAFCATS